MHCLLATVEFPRLLGCWIQADISVRIRPSKRDLTIVYPSRLSDIHIFPIDHATRMRPRSVRRDTWFAFYFSPAIPEAALFAFSSRNSHAFAIFQSRRTVSAEISRIVAVSSTLSPPK